MSAVSRFFRFGPALLVAAFAAAGSHAPARAETAAAPATSAAPACTAPAELARLVHPLKRFAHRVAGGLPVKIVAFMNSIGPRTWTASARHQASASTSPIGP